MVSGVQSQVGLGLLQQALQSQQNAANLMIQSQQQTNKTISQDGDGDHGLEPQKGQNINKLG